MGDFKIPASVDFRNPPGTDDSIFQELADPSAENQNGARALNDNSRTVLTIWYKLCRVLEWSILEPENDALGKAI